MKIGIRTPSLKKMVKARTTAQVKRKVKKAIIPGYGQKGMGILHPKKMLYNKVYNATTISAKDTIKAVAPKQEVYEQVGICPNCNKEVPINSNFCQFCGCNFIGVQYEGVCPNCFNPINPTDRFCIKCGKQLRG